MFIDLQFPIGACYCQLLGVAYQYGLDVRRIAIPGGDSRIRETFHAHEGCLTRGFILFGHPTNEG
jgi:glucan biosynthesis protein